MKKFSLIILFIAVAFSSKAQQIPLYSNYFFTPYIYNPSYSGTSGVTEATVLHRRQWSGIQGSPETSALALNGSLNDEKIGWSVYGFSDQTDILQRLGAYGNYAYHVKLSDNSTLSFGLGAGYINQSIDQSAVRARDAGDVFTVVAPSRGTFDLNAGLNLRIADFTLGAAAPQLLAQNINYSENGGDINYGLLRHYVINAQYDFKFNGDKQVLSPLVMVRAADQNVPVQIDAGLLFNLTEYGYVGAMYRSDYAVTANIGVNLTEQLTFGYAYDFSLNEYGSSFGMSNEFMLTYRFGNNKDNERMENELKRLKLDQRKQRDATEELVDEKLEEFKDSYREEIKKEFDEQRKQLEAELKNRPANQGGANNGGNQNNGNGNQNQNQDNFNNQNNPNQGNNQQNGNGQNNNTGNAGNNNNNNNGGNQGTGNRMLGGNSGYYVTAGVFSRQDNAEQLVTKLAAQGFNARYFRDGSNNFYYVYLLRYSSYQQADQAKANKLNGSYNGDLWIKAIQ
jgi:type IX secretion system PorP/SprF family membrane protein